MINISNSTLKSISAHRMFLHSDKRYIKVSEMGLDTLNMQNDNALLKFLCSPFQEVINYHFSSIDKNELYLTCLEIFSDPGIFHFKSIDCANSLYQDSPDSTVDSAEFVMIYISEILIGDELTDAIGFFLIENKSTFLKVEQLENKLSLFLTSGVLQSKIEKACLVLNDDRDSGFNVLCPRKLKSQETTRHWIEDFLNVKQKRDEYFKTDRMINLCRQFAEEGLMSDKLDKLDLVQGTVQYLSDNDSFNMDDYERDVIRQPELIDAFQEYRDSFDEGKEALPDHFEISRKALSYNKRYIRSILKLDKNFHVYVHGNRENIIRGFDPDRKQYYYQLYFDQEQ